MSIETSFPDAISDLPGQEDFSQGDVKVHLHNSEIVLSLLYPHIGVIIFLILKIKQLILWLVLRQA